MTSWWLGFTFGLGLVWASRRRRTTLVGKTALVTGGSRGLGLQVARELVARGARVAICGRDPVALARAKADLEARGGHVIAVTADLTDPYELADLVRAVRAELGPVDLLVNNAGAIHVAPLAQTSWDHRRYAMELHCWAPLRLVEALLPDLAARGGSVVNVTSVGGRVAVPHLAAYTASKHAQVGLSHALRIELARFGVRVLTVVPGLMNTGSPTHASFGGDAGREHAWFASLDAAPLLAMSAARAARRIVRAVERGRTELVLGPTARLAVWSESLAPAATYGIAAAIDRRLLPRGGEGRPVRPGRELASPRERSGRARRAIRWLNQESP